MQSTQKISSLPSERSLPVIFLHGFSGDGDGLRHFATAYAGDGAICINLPGFGGTPAPEVETHGDIQSYCEDIWREIRRYVPHGPVHLVGHSHGAMIGFALASLYQDVVRLDLFCPVARPRFAPRVVIHFLHLLRQMGIPARVIIRMVAHPFLVSLVTRYSFRPEWSKRVRQQISRMREREARYYSPVMFDLMDQTLRFMTDMKNVTITTPTYLCYVTDENVASGGDFSWYQKHANVRKTVALTGGHLCVVADPERVADAVRKGGF